MSEHINSTTNTQAPESVTGLAMTLGSLRSDLHHHIEDNARAHDEIQIRLSEAIEARESAHAELDAKVDQLAGLVQQAVETMAEYTSRNPSAPAKASTASPPKRAAKENNKTFYGRLLAWAEQHDAAAPPKPTTGEFSNAYDTRVREWAQAIGS